MAFTMNRGRAMRRWRLVFAAAVIIPVVTGAVMTAQHGPAFFVFRAAGTGFTPAGALAESQGPGQPGAPQAARPAAAPVPAPVVWAGIARRPGGRWSVISSGTSRARVAFATAVHWNRWHAHFASACAVLPMGEAAALGLRGAP